MSFLTIVLLYNEAYVYVLFIKLNNSKRLWKQQMQFMLLYKHILIQIFILKWKENSLWSRQQIKMDLYFFIRLLCNAISIHFRANTINLLNLRIDIKHNLAHVSFLHLFWTKYKVIFSIILSLVIKQTSGILIPWLPLWGSLY